MQQIKLTFTTHGSIQIKRKTTLECEIQIYVFSKENANGKKEYFIPKAIG